MIKITCLEDIAALRESGDIECKLAQGRDGKRALPNDMRETYSAFPNTRGVEIKFGMNDPYGRFTALNDDQFFSSGGLELSFGGLKIGSGGSEVSSGGKRQSSGGKDELRAIASSIAQVKKASRADMEDVIMKLCAVRPIKQDELGELLNRNGEFLRKDYLQGLIRSRRLKLLYPTQRQHPDQAYMTEESSE